MRNLHRRVHSGGRFVVGNSIHDHGLISYLIHRDIDANKIGLHGIRMRITHLASNFVNAVTKSNLSLSVIDSLPRILKKLCSWLVDPLCSMVLVSDALVRRLHPRVAGLHHICTAALIVIVIVVDDNDLAHNFLDLVIFLILTSPFE
jgi:hypothetical protein